MVTQTATNEDVPAAYMVGTEQQIHAEAAADGTVGIERHSATCLQEDRGFLGRTDFLVVLILLLLGRLFVRQHTGHLRTRILETRTLRIAEDEYFFVLKHHRSLDLRTGIEHNDFRVQTCRESQEKEGECELMY